MSIEYIRRADGVPAKVGGRVEYRGRPGTITGSDNGYLRIKLDGESRSKNYHPEYETKYTRAGE